MPYKKSLICAIVFHVVLLCFLLFSWERNSQPIALPGSQVPIIHAIAIPTSALQNNLAHHQAPLTKKQPEPIKERPQPEPKPEEVVPPKPKPKTDVKPKPEKPKPTPVKKVLPPVQPPQVKKTYSVAAQEEKKQQPAQVKPKPKKIEKNELKTQAPEQPKVDTKKEPIKEEQKPEKKTLKQDDKKSIAQRKKELNKELMNEMAKQDQTQDKANEVKDLLKEELQAADESPKANSSPNPAASLSKAEQGIIDKYKALIKSAIEEHWNVPSETSKDLTCKLLITLAPGGSVLNVQVTKTSGMPALDQSAIQAVYQASPLPIPDDASLFEQFRQVNLTVKPENIVDQ